MRLLSSLLPALLLASSLAAHADTYLAQTIYTGQAEPYAVDDFGDYTLLFGVEADNEPAGCPYYGVGDLRYCFLTHYQQGNVKVAAYADAAPSLPTDPNPIAGPGCPAAPVNFSLFSCVNGHPYYRGDYGQGIYSAPNLLSLIAGGYGGDPKESPSGNLLYYTADDTEVLILDTTTLATTPEPSSFALLGTGLLGVVGIIKRRQA